MFERSESNTVEVCLETFMSRFSMTVFLKKLFLNPLCLDSEIAHYAGTARTAIWVHIDTIHQKRW